MDISTIVTVYNNEDTINELYEKISSVFEKIGRSYELIFINDASTDNSWEIIKDLQKKDPHIKAIDFRRHYGESAGLQAGFDLSKGDYVFTISPSLENDPEVFEELYEKVQTEECDMVLGVRKGRYDGRPISRLYSKIAHKILDFAAKKKFSDITSPVRIIEREVVDNMRLHGDNYLYVPAIATLYGAKFGEVEIKHQKPKSQNFRYQKINLFKFLADILFLKIFVSSTTPPFNLAPMRLFGGIGFLSGFLGFVAGLYLTFQKFYLGLDIGGRPLLLLAVLMLILGAIFLIFGFLGEIIIRTYFEGQSKLTYTTREKLIA